MRLCWEGIYISPSMPLNVANSQGDTLQLPDVFESLEVSEVYVVMNVVHCVKLQLHYIVQRPLGAELLVSSIPSLNL